MTYSLMRDFFPQPCFEPFTIALLAGTALSAAGTVAAGSAKAGQARQVGENEAIRAETDATNLENKAEIETQQAQNELDVGAAEAGDFELEQSAAASSQIASSGGSGLQFSGSKVAITESDFEAIEFGVSRIASNARTGEFRLKQSAEFSRANAKTAKANAVRVRTASKRTKRNIVGASLLAAGGQVASGVASSGLSFGAGSGAQWTTTTVPPTGNA